MDTDKYLREIIKQRGHEIKVTTPEGTWLVPRVYIAKNGLKAVELPLLAKRMGWPKVV